MVTLTERRESVPENGFVWLAAWPVLAVFVLSNAATPLYVVWQRELGFSSGTLTAIFASYIVGLLGALLVAGVVSDRVGRKPVLLPAIALAMVACVLFATASSVAVLAVARLLTGIAVGAAVSAGMAAVTDVGGPGRKRLAALAASSAMVLGAGFGPLLSGVLSETVPGPTVTVFVAKSCCSPRLSWWSHGWICRRVRAGAARGFGFPRWRRVGAQRCCSASRCSRRGSPRPRSCCRSARHCSRTCSAPPTEWSRARSPS
ncbi:MFS transporter [Nocardia sp. CA-128927]|uniref:MFS transporter n=1 Tax=Nocardia sp. CA-128927 TaxID=3239975 RepID=UPI003D9928BA